MKYLLRIVFIISFLFITAFASAQYNDITMMEEVSPLYELDNSISSKVISSDNEEITVHIDNIVVEKDRILVRILFKDLNTDWKNKITDENRLYGSYLPVAETVLDGGDILTPSSASKFSYLEYNNQCIIGGLLVFNTDKTPQTFYLNINQIPFDTKPLSEGLSLAVVLHNSNKHPETGQKENKDSRNSDIEFSLTATAQTGSLTMLQPCVRMNRPDEILSKFGWITISNTNTGKRYAVTRGNLYGFNLTDDTEYSPAHSYTFDALHTQDVLEITMDHAYIVRNIVPAQKNVLDLNSQTRTVLLDTKDFHLEVYELNYVPEEDRIRIYIDSGEKQVADISFIFDNKTNVFNPSVNCGFAPETDRFACDFYFNDISFPVNQMDIEIDAVEYLSMGPWTITWTPVPTDPEESSTMPESSPLFLNQYGVPDRKKQPEEIRIIEESIDKRNQELTKSAGWIHESYETNYQFGDSFHQELIPMDQYRYYYTHYISDIWHYIDNNHIISKMISIVRDPETGQILSAQLQTDGRTLDMIHALLAETKQPLSQNYTCFPDFRQLIDSSAVFMSDTACDETGNDQHCLNFYQSLNGMPDSANSQRITFRFDKENEFLLSESISYNIGALELQKDTLILENADKLPEDLVALIDSIQ